MRRRRRDGCSMSIDVSRPSDESWYGEREREREKERERERERERGRERGREREGALLTSS